MDDLLCAMEHKQCSALILLDQSAAFDTVNQDLMLHRLQSSYGICENALQWLKTYFKGRTQSVCIDNKSSASNELITGFPQGSVLGPFIYPTYTSPLFKIAEKHGVEIHMYADDTQLYISFRLDDSDNALEKIQNCINEIRKWMHENHLKLNDTKTEFLIIGNPRLTKQLNVSSIKIGDTDVTAACQAGNIGAIIDSELSMVPHVASVCKKCYFNLYNISRIRKFLTTEAASMIVNALVTSKIDYANAILYGVPDYLLKRLQLIQNNAARLVLRKKRHDHITPLLEKLHWLPICYRIEYKLMLLTFKCIHSLAPLYLCELLSLYIPSHDLRTSSQNLLKEKRGHKRSGDRSFSVAAPKLWNKLPDSLRQIDKLPTFKTALKTYYFTKAFRKNM
jgi:hypothetical protein